ncbi:peptide/nickel transport system substrate-binding protein [Desulfotomaculum arcticum]|uniref:Peptide/nickel transport system substrate-binding protein n=1 Tax=Desulfotruncus arcticus DSM 17038 TaxID=1121424 RepID=A0A1I2NV20_9FIRM|nr:ABC transporter substrate-binding protein [Desulfotruncus arcticus]SFG07722.1 peptide/nickel transport system substrate-binding protein [Desulfotomaculum arcticum] [Desulfotruncus arcticus DSM 17038]
MLRKHLAIIVMLLLIGALSLFLFGCGGDQAGNDQKPAAAAGAGQQQAEVIKLAGGDWGYPNPYTYYPRGPGSRKTALIFDGLVTVDAGEKVLPALAGDWQAGGDGLSYTFQLRPGVKWHDGRPFTAGDVVFSYEYAKRYPPVSVIDFSGVKKMAAVDDRTVAIELDQPDPNFLTGLTGLKIIPRHIWEQVTDPLNFVAPEAAVGTGPYMLTDYSKEHGTYRYEANEYFWGSKPRVKVIEFVPVSEDILAFEQGEIDRISVTPDILPRFENNPEYRVMQYETSWAYRLYFNMRQRPELADQALRQALAYAIDRRELVEKVERGAAVAGNPGVLHPNNPLYNSGVPQYSCDRQKAQDLLAGLGYQDAGGGVRSNSRGEKLSFTLLADEGSARLAELIKQQLALTGMEVNVQVVDSKTRDARFLKGDFELCINGSGGGEDLKEVTGVGQARATSTTAAVIGYQNPEVDRLYAAQEQETDPDKRRQLMAELQQIVAEELPKLTLYYRNTLAVHRPAVYDGWSGEIYHHDSRINFVAD